MKFWPQYLTCVGNSNDILRLGACIPGLEPCSYASGRPGTASQSGHGHRWKARPIICYWPYDFFLLTKSRVTPDFRDNRT